MMKKIRFSFILLIVFFSLVLSVAAQPAAQKDAAEIQLALKKLNVLGSVLYIAAHPDDENTALLAYLAKDKLVDAAYLALTRGAGGQNLIGSEKGELMGVLRTQELIAARKIDGAQQFFTRALDFGYSKSAEESMEIWGYDAILADMVRVIRMFRPDILITRFPQSGGGHGHHTASAILAQQAFQAAGDANRFTEQLTELEPWQPTRLVWNSWRPQLTNRPAGQPPLTHLDLGKYNPLLGQSYTEIAAKNRSMHKSQGFGSGARRGSYVNYFEHVAGKPANNNLFDDINMSWSRVPNSETVQATIDKAIQSFDPEKPDAILPLLLSAYDEMTKLADNYWVNQKKQETLQLISDCAGLWYEADATTPSAHPGETVNVKISVINRSHFPISLKQIEFPFVHPDSLINASLGYNEPLTIETAVKIPQQEPYSNPYWLRQDPQKGRYRIADPELIGLAQAPPQLQAKLILAANHEELTYQVPLSYRRVDPVAGEQYQKLEIIPKVMVNLDENIFVFPDNKPKQVQAEIRSGGANISGNLAFGLPAGWKTKPARIPFQLAKKNEEKFVTFTLYPPNHFSEENVKIIAQLPGEDISRSLVQFNYPHIPKQMLFPPASAKVVRLDLQRHKQLIGYVMGSGDDIPGCLQQIGYNVKLLTDVQLENEDLSKYDTIIMGIRAYNTRPQLKQQQKRLLDYVHAGGTMLVQYNVTRGLLMNNIGPYPFQISHDRVSVEDAPVTFLQPDHQILNSPNSISKKDFDNWIQERGLYFANDWSSNYQTVISSHDPGESAKAGGLLVANYGRGIFIYTGYSWFRQLPAGVPGAYKIFVNLVEAGYQNGAATNGSN